MLDSSLVMPNRMPYSFWLRLALVVTSLAASGLQVKADTILVGVLSFDSVVPAAPGAPGINGFTIYNFTGTNSQPGTPNSALSFLNTSVLLDGSQTVNIGTIAPGSVQPASLQFPTATVFTDAEFSATLDTNSFTIAGQNYVATSDLVSADLTPATPLDLEAGSDFVELQIEATLSSTIVPEPAVFWLSFGPLASR